MPTTKIKSRGDGDRARRERFPLPVSALYSPASPSTLIAPAQTDLRSRFQLCALMTSCPSVIILDFITLSSCGLKPSAGPQQLCYCGHRSKLQKCGIFGSVQSAPDPQTIPLCHSICGLNQNKKIFKIIIILKKSQTFYQQTPSGLYAHSRDDRPQL